MTELTQAEIRNEVLSIFEENEAALQNFTEKIEQIESEAIEAFERKSISIKNSIINDENIKDEDIESAYLNAIASLKDQILKETKERMEQLVKSLGDN